MILASGQARFPHSEPSLAGCRIMTRSTSTMQRRHQAIPLQQAAQESPTFARLADLVRESSARLQAIRGLLPAPLRASVQAGPLEDGCWCLLVSSNAVAAKMRQLLPALQAHLSIKGLGVTSIRIKVQNRVP